MRSFLLEAVGDRAPQEAPSARSRRQAGGAEGLRWKARRRGAGHTSRTSMWGDPWPLLLHLVLSWEVRIMG